MINVGEDYSKKGDIIELNVAEGAAITEVMLCESCRDLILHINTEGIAAGEQFVFTVQGRLSDVFGWDNMSATDATYTVTEDGDLLITFDRTIPKYVSVGVAATVASPSMAGYTILAQFGSVS